MPGGSSTHLVSTPLKASIILAVLAGFEIAKPYRRACTNATLLKLPALRADGHTVFEIDAALRRLVEVNGSDLHLKVGTPPLMRVNGDLGPIPDEPALR